MKIFIGTEDIAGIGTSLCRGFHEIGIDADVVVEWRHPFDYGIHAQPSWIVRFWMCLIALNNRTSQKQFIQKGIVSTAVRLVNFMVLFWSLRKFNAFIFLFGKTITKTKLELWLIKAMGKRIVFLYLGSDTRPPYMNGSKYPDGCVVDLKKARSLTAEIKQRLNFQEKYSDVCCINSPASAQFHVKPFINWFAVGLPKYVTNGSAHEINCHPNRKVRILHSPSNPSAKGSPVILRSIERLKAKGHPIEFIKIENMPNSKVLEEMRQCDFVVDQLYSDTPLATFATEAAHFGKPSVIGGYFAPVMNDYIHKENIPPSLFIHPDDIEQAIEKLIVDVDYRLELGRRAQIFVETNWAPAEVARRFLRVITGDIPSEWWYDPHDIRYIHGCGIPESHTRHIVRAMIDRYGKGSLQVEDKPGLEKAFLDFAQLDAVTIKKGDES